MSMLLWRNALLGLALVVAGLSGCADEVTDINRVQPHYVKKADLDGQWFYRQTVVDMPPEYGIAFSGIECGLQKIRFEVREDALIAYRTHEAIPGLEADETAEGASFRGDPVAAFPITSHFDIVRDYNRQNGEQSNVLVEDTSTRPWYERDYMRVDWQVVGRVSASVPALPSAVDCSGIVLVNYVGRGGEGYGQYVRDTDKFNPDHLRIDHDHIFFTQTANVTDGGYACWADHGYSNSIYGSPCGSVEAKVRHAFARIDAEAEAQFEPVSHLDSELMNEAAEPFTDANANGRYEQGEAFQDQNGNGKWDGQRRIKYATVSVGPDRDFMVDVACTPEVLDALRGEVTAEDCRDLQWHHDGRFGFFRSERTAYDRLVGGGHDDNRQHLANHHQIWKRTRDDAGNPLPAAQRQLKPVVYYLNPGFPEDLKTTAVQLGRDWNEVFMEAAVAGTGKTRSAIEAQLKGDFDDEAEIAVWMKGDDGQTFGPEALFQVRDNTCSVPGVEAYLKRFPELKDVVDEATEGRGLLPGNLQRACSGLTWESQARDLEPRFTWQQMGDVRFSFIWWVNEAQPSGPLGYGPSSPDPETGRIVSGNAYIYGAAVDEYARRSADIVRAINGELCDGDADQTDCLVQGRSYLDWLGRGGAATAAEVAEITPEYQRMISDRLGGAGMAAGRSFMTEKGVDKAAMRRNMSDRMERPQASDPMTWASEAPANEGQQRLKALMQNPSFRARMISEPMLQAVAPLFGWQPGTDVPEEMKDLALKLTLDRGALRERAEKQQRFLSERNVMLKETLDDSVIGQALALKGMDPEEVYQQLRREIFEAVMLHEVGHTVGLRHNFKASFDALNYQDEFWEIRDRFSQGEWDAQRLPEYRYASIMDYGARFNSDTKGLGKYDHAAIKYVYAGQAEVFDDGVPVPGRLDIELEYEDYSHIPRCWAATWPT
ncbi:MAG: zinc-dependent metalloprotease [bacterium]